MRRAAFGTGAGQRDRDKDKPTPWVARQPISCLRLICLRELSDGYRAIEVCFFNSDFFYNGICRPNNNSQSKRRMFLLILNVIKRMKNINLFSLTVVRSKCDQVKCYFKNCKHGHSDIGNVNVLIFFLRMLTYKH